MIRNKYIEFSAKFKSFIYNGRWSILKYPAAVGKITLICDVSGLRGWYRMNENAMSSLRLVVRAANSAGHLRLWLQLLTRGRKNVVGRRFSTS